MKDEFEIKELVSRNKISASRDDMVEQVTEVKQRYKTEIERLNLKITTERKDYLESLEKTLDVFALKVTQSHEDQSKSEKEQSEAVLALKVELEEQRKAKDEVIKKMVKAQEEQRKQHDAAIAALKNERDELLVDQK